MNRVLLHLLMLLSLAACAPLAGREAAPVAVDPAPLLASVRRAADLADSLRGLAQVSSDSPGGHFSASQAILAARPDRLRTEALSMFGSPLMILATDGATLHAWLPGQNRFYAGPATADNLRRFLHLPLSLPDLVRLLHYDIPLMGGEAAGSRVGDAWQLVVTEGERRAVVRFDAKLRPVSFRLLTGEKELFSVSYGHFAASDGFPRRIRFEQRSENRRLQIDFKSLELGPGLDDSLFRLKPPAGAVFYPLQGADS
ncbi:outer membrane lipoprotein-sorting protein [Geothermobacter ehrlichii]|uniref:Outer membrane lipoprotein-sorting protein n=1 Tax=Geothermobacter ehrlichii TaxID=213224 RepID=A0A5D3WLJ5_9BACT|nr:hypothetical protein [Geothermobacter ehrlichii]TYO99582.1 outer membrane lipoprotein-sorting protein [Geothermobacter ehrlichii]